MSSNTHEQPPMPPNGPDPNQNGPLNRVQAGLQAARMAVGSQLQGLSTRDFDRDTAHTRHYTTKYSPHTEEVRHPLTGHPETVDTVRTSRFAIPVSRRERTRLHPPSVNDESLDDRTSHGSLAAIRTGLQRGSFYNAYVSVNALQDRLLEAAEGKQGIISNTANLISPKGRKREDAIIARHSAIMRTVYDSAMAVPNTLNGREDNQDWSAELNLYNIQALRSQVRQRWHRNGGDQRQFDANMRASGILSTNPGALAAYLDVDPQALLAQTPGGREQVVPPEILTKINFFLQFAEDRTPDENLGECLAQFGDNEPGTEDTGPTERLNNYLNPIEPRIREYTGDSETIHNVRLTQATGSVALSSNSLFAGGNPFAGTKPRTLADHNRDRDKRTAAQQAAAATEQARRQQAEDQRRTQREDAQRRHEETLAAEQQRHADTLAAEQQRHDDLMAAQAERDRLSQEQATRANEERQRAARRRDQEQNARDAVNAAMLEELRLAREARERSEASPNVTVQQTSAEGPDDDIVDAELVED